MKPVAKPRQNCFLVMEDDHSAIKKCAKRDGKAVTDYPVNRPLNEGDFVTSPCNTATGNQQPSDAEKEAWNCFNIGDLLIAPARQGPGVDSALRHWLFLEHRKARIGQVHPLSVICPTLPLKFSVDSAILQRYHPRFPGPGRDGIGRTTRSGTRLFPQRTQHPLLRRRIHTMTTVHSRLVLLPRCVSILIFFSFFFTRGGELPRVVRPRFSETAGAGVMDPN